MKIFAIEGGNKLFVLITERLMTKSEFAKDVPVSESVVLNALRGNKTSLKTARAICKYLDVEFTEYFNIVNE